MPRNPVLFTASAVWGFTPLRDQRRSARIMFLVATSGIRTRELREHAGHIQWCIGPACDGNRLFVVVRGRPRVPVPNNNLFTSLQVPYQHPCPRIRCGPSTAVACHNRVGRVEMIINERGLFGGIPGNRTETPLIVQSTEILPSILLTSLE